ncbi:MAG: outer membrane protein [Vitreimonas sp.]
MKRLVLRGAVAACAAAMTAPAQAMDMFVEGGLGPVFESDLDVSGASQTAEADANAFLAIGVADVGGLVDIRLEYATTDRSYENSLFAQLQTSSLMLNASVDFAERGPVNLYAGGGLGAVDVAFHGVPFFFDGVDGSETVFGWQLVGGVRARILSSPFSAFGELRYQAAADATVDGVDIEYNSASFMAGVRWRF